MSPNQKSTPPSDPVPGAWADVSLGGSGAVLAVADDGSLWGWGANMFGQLGDGTTVQNVSPTRIGGETDWAHVYAGLGHSLGIKTDGTLWAWGLNLYGQLGVTTTTTLQGFPVALVPVQVGTDSNWARIIPGIDATLVLKTDGTLWAWGHNNTGELGDGTTTDRPTPVRIGNRTDWNTARSSPAPVTSSP